LARLLYVRSWSKQQIIDLFSVIDWLMQIPAQLQKQLWHELRELEKDREMPYMNMFEKFGREQGLEEGRKEGRKAALSEILEVQLEKRFGDLPPHVRDRLQQAEAVDLLAWAAALVDAPSLDRVFFRSQAS
jgi:flagellar biosynthesis/type III secretory pathway protein FliH